MFVEETFYGKDKKIEFPWSIFGQTYMHLTKWLNKVSHLENVSRVLNITDLLNDTHYYVQKLGHKITNIYRNLEW